MADLVDGTPENRAIGVQAEVSTLADPFKGISLDDKFDLTKQSLFDWHVGYRAPIADAERAGSLRRP